jgi:hypothetical protein
MVDFGNFDDFWYVAQHNWFWLLASLAIGIIVGWLTSEPENS